MSTKSSCTLTSLAVRNSVLNDSTTTLIKTLACFGRGQTLCESDHLTDFCTSATEVQCGSQSLNRSLPVSKCHCQGLGNCFCSFSCSGSLAMLTCYFAFFLYAQFFGKKESAVLNAFSIRRNFRKIVDKIPGESLTCLNWMRAFSLMSVLAGHFHQIMSKVVTEPPTKNSFFSMVLLHNMSLSVDTFLLLGGLLHAYTWVLKANSGRIPNLNLAFWVRFCFQRWYRLAPSLVVMILVSNVIGHLILPELWMGSADPQGDCSATWPAMVTFTNNIFPNTCMRWLWYLAMDVQLNFLALPFLLSLSKFDGRKIFGFSLFIIAISLLYRGYLANVLEIPILYVADAPVWEKIMQSIYVKPFPRLAPYLIGLLLGANLDEAVVFVSKTSKLTSITLLSFLMLFYAYFGGFFEYFFNVVSWHRIFYLSIFRTVFTLALSWYALMCTSRQVRFFKRLRKFPLWRPVARLSFSAYLIHPLVIGGSVQYLLHSHVPIALNIDFIVALGGAVGIACVLFFALGFFVVVEQPIANLRPLIENKIVNFVSPVHSTKKEH